ncbi:HxlR family transcriptional regulator [Saccharothrix saharensis]|uniref:HxlR family transcriptional regulator n=1 Tax=Saccharothrix saharensis TaxID=571190 RepID=A0A543JFP4_9PSEU|nr:helix-turn-helix domain-containing protein [Saccharothrix saharensis]TQM81657.1 HxlR family transcriptional regulator [Saccharothrix saharensis]
MTNQTVSAGLRTAPRPPASATAWSGDPHGEVDHPVPTCPVEVTLRALRGRWTTLVVRELFAGERTFGDLATALPALSDKVLADRLAQLVTTGVVVRVREPGWPTRVRYSLTARGRALREVLEAMWAWGLGATGAAAPPGGADPVALRG